MPSVGVSRDEPRRPDIVIGDRYGTSCAGLLPDVVEEIMSGLGYSIGRNKPYAGGFITEHYGNPASGLHTVQLELNRAIYMDERRRERPRFAQVAADFAALANALARCRSGISGRSRRRRSSFRHSATSRCGAPDDRESTRKTRAPEMPKIKDGPKEKRAA